MDEQEQQQRFPLRIDFHVPEDMQGLYATNLVVQHTENEFILSFFETFPPMLLGSPEDIKADLQQISSVRAKCVARIIVSAGKMPEFVQVLHDNLGRYLKSREPE